MIGVEKIKGIYLKMLKLFGIDENNLFCKIIAKYYKLRY